MLKKPQKRVHQLAFDSVNDLLKRKELLNQRQSKKPSPLRKALIERIGCAVAIKQMQDGGTGLNLNEGNSNGTESLFAEAACKKGWTVTKRGWPDFLCWKDGELIAVEVKPENHLLRMHQELVNQQLEQAGIKCYVWRPVSGFKRIGNAKKP